MVAVGGARSDAALLEAWRHGDASAATALVRRHAPAVLAFLRRRTDPIEAEDLAQATLLTLVRRRDDIADASTIGNWVLGVARRLLAQRRRRVWTARVDLGLATLRHSVHPSQVVDDEACARRRDAAVAKLPPALHEIARAYFVDGSSAACIAEASGLPEGTVRTRLRAIRARLARLLAPRARACLGARPA